MNIRLLARVLVTAMVCVSIVAPAATFAATPESPECLMAVLTKDTGKVFTTDTVHVTKGSWVYVLWVSTNDSVAHNSAGAVVAHSGFVYASADQSATYSYRFTANGEEVTCSATLTVDDPASNYVLGPTTLRVVSVPLLTGGLVGAGVSVPVAYLQVANVGTFATLLKGFQLQQRGSTPDAAITELSTIDDSGVFRASTSGTSGAPFVNRVGVAPASVVLMPGQQRLFTIRASTAYQSLLLRGTQLKLDVTGVETAPKGTVEGIFPLRGTIWTVQ